MLGGVRTALLSRTASAAAATVPVNSINQEDDTAILLEDGTELLLEA